MTNFFKFLTVLLMKKNVTVQNRLLTSKTVPMVLGNVHSRICKLWSQRLLHRYGLWNHWIIDRWLLVDLLINLEQIFVMIHWLLLILWLQKVLKSDLTSTIADWSCLNRVILGAGTSCFDKEFLFRPYSWLILLWWRHVIIEIFSFCVLYQDLSHTVNELHGYFISLILIEADIFRTGIKLGELTLH